MVHVPIHKVGRLVVDVTGGAELTLLPVAVQLAATYVCHQVVILVLKVWDVFWSQEQRQEIFKMIDALIAAEMAADACHAPTTPF